MNFAKRIAAQQEMQPKTKVPQQNLLLNWFRADGQLSSGVVEGFNNKVKLVTRKSYGFRTQEGSIR